MLRSIAASSGQRARKAGEQGRSESESNHPEREQRFYLPSQSLVKAGTFAYLRTSLPSRARGNCVMGLFQPDKGDE
jgi:hypothetical protein